MAEILVKFTEPIRAGDGRSYVVQVCGGIAGDGLWEGWIEFISPDGRLRTGRETEQPNRDDLLYWAEGLTIPYLDGALERARRAEKAPRVVAAERTTLDPFAEYAEGEENLRRRLTALSREELHRIVATHRLNDGEPHSVIEHASAAELAEHIVRNVRRRFEQPASTRSDSSRANPRP